jgi:flagellar L-ring protein precursor FlgH
MKNGYAIILLLLSCAQKPLAIEPFSEKQGDSNDPVKPLQYSSQDRLPAVEQREYIRMTRERLERENDVGSQAGSMWVMDGQGSYLFVQNKVRKEGDLLSIRLEGQALKQVEMKVSVIKKLLEQIEHENKKFKDNNRLKANPNSTEDSNRNLASDESKKEESKLDIEIIPSRIVEKLPDGNYRVAGQQSFILGQRDFKVSLTGLIRAEDYSDEGVSSNKLIEPDIDVLSVRKKKNESL